MRPSEGRQGRARRPGQTRGPNTAGDVRPVRAARGLLAAVAAILATAAGLVAAVAGLPALAASLAASLAFAACWLAALGTARALARVFGRR